MRRCTQQPSAQCQQLSDQAAAALSAVLPSAESTDQGEALRQRQEWMRGTYSNYAEECSPTPTPGTARS